MSVAAQKCPPSAAGAARSHAELSTCGPWARGLGSRYPDPPPELSRDLRPEARVWGSPAPRTGPSQALLGFYFGDRGTEARRLPWSSTGTGLGGRGGPEGGWEAGLAPGGGAEGICASVALSGGRGHSGRTSLRRCQRKGGPGRGACEWCTRTPSGWPDGAAGPELRGRPDMGTRAQDRPADARPQDVTLLSPCVG